MLYFIGLFITNLKKVSNLEVETSIQGNFIFH
jgi:hypothetical protein